MYHVPSSGSSLGDISPSCSPGTMMTNAPRFGTTVPNRIFVGGITTDTSECDLESLFARFGSVSAVKIISDRAGVPKGYGFITFETEEEAKRVLREGDNLVLKGRKLNVAIAIKKQQVGRIESHVGYGGMNGATTYSIFPTTNGLSPFNPFDGTTAYYTDPTTAAIYSSFAPVPQVPPPVPQLTSPMSAPQHHGGLPHHLSHHHSHHQLSGSPYTTLGGQCPSTALGPPPPPPSAGGIQLTGTGGPSPYHHHPHHPAALFYSPHPHVTFIAQPPPYTTHGGGSNGPPGHGQVTGLTPTTNGTSGGGYHTHHGSSPIPVNGGSQSWGQPPPTHYQLTSAPTGQQQGGSQSSQSSVGGATVMVNNPMNHVS